MPGGCPSEGFKVLLKGYSDPSPENVRALVEIMTYGSSSETDQLIRQRSAPRASARTTSPTSRR